MRRQPNFRRCQTKTVGRVPFISRPSGSAVAWRGNWTRRTWASLKGRASSYSNDPHQRKRVERRARSSLKNLRQPVLE